MIDEQNGEENSNRNNNNRDDESLTDRIPSRNSQPAVSIGASKNLNPESQYQNHDIENHQISLSNIHYSTPENTETKDVRDIVQSITKAVFHVIDDNFDRLNNRSSNTLGMRVKDSLILKVQQANRKEIPFDGIKTSLVCRLVVNDDQACFLPYIDVESPAPSSASENLSTKQKKSVSLDEDVRVFDGVENDFFAPEEVSLVTEVVEIENDGTESKNTVQNVEENNDFIFEKNFKSSEKNRSDIGVESSHRIEDDEFRKQEEINLRNVDTQEILTPKTTSNSDENQFSRTREETKSKKLIFQDDKTKDKVTERENVDVSQSSSQLEFFSYLLVNTRNSRSASDQSDEGQKDLSKNGNVKMNNRSKPLNGHCDAYRAGTNEELECLKPTNEQKQKGLFRKSPKENQPGNAEAAKDSSNSLSVKNCDRLENLKTMSNKTSDDIVENSNTLLLLDENDSEHARDDVKNDKRKEMPVRSESKSSKRSRDKYVAVESSVDNLSASPSGSERNEKRIDSVEYLDEKSSLTKPSVLNVNIEIKLKEEQSTIENVGRSKHRKLEVSNSSSKDNLNDSCNKRREGTNDLYELDVVEKVSRKRSATGKASRENTNISSDIVVIPTTDIGKNMNDDKKKINHLPKFVKDFLSTSKKRTRDKSTVEESHVAENSQSVQSLENLKLQSSSILALDTVTAELDQSGEERNFENGRTSANLSAEKLRNDEIILSSKTPSTIQSPRDVEVIERTERVDRLVNAMQVDLEDGQVIENVTESNDDHASDNYSNDSRLKSSYMLAEESESKVEKSVSLPGEFANHSPGIEKEIECKEIMEFSAKKPSLFSRIVRSKKNTVSKENKTEQNATAEQENSAVPKIGSELLVGTQSSSVPRTNSLNDLGDGKRNSTLNVKLDENVTRKIDSKEISKTKSLNRVSTLGSNKPNTELTLGKKKSGLTNDQSWKKTSEKVSLTGSILSKKLSRMDSNDDKQSGNDPSLKKTSSKVSLQEGGKSSATLLETDDNKVISLNLNKPVETLPISGNDSELRNSYSVDTDVNKIEQKLTEELKINEMGLESYLKRIQTQAYPIATEDILKPNLPSTGQSSIAAEASQQQETNKEIDAMNIKANDSRWSLRSEKSKTDVKEGEKLLSDNETEANVTDNRVDVSRKSSNVREPMKRKKFMLNVVSKSSPTGGGVIEDREEPKDVRANTEDTKPKLLFKFKTGKFQNKTENNLASLQLFTTSVTTNDQTSVGPDIQASVDAKEPSSLSKSLKRSLQSKRKRSKASAKRSKAMLKIDTESQTDMDVEFASKHSTDFENGNDNEKSSKPLQSLALKSSNLSPLSKENLLISQEYMGENISLIDGDVQYDEKSINSKNLLVDPIISTDVENMFEETFAVVSKRSADVIPRNVIELYSVVTDSETNNKRSISSPREITNSHSILDGGKNLQSERRGCGLGRNEKKSVPNLELEVKYSEDSESCTLGRSGNINTFSPKVKKSFSRLRQMMHLRTSSKETLKKSENDCEFPESKDSANRLKSEEKLTKRSKGSVKKELKKEHRKNEEHETSDEHILAKAPEPIESTIRNTPAVIFKSPNFVAATYLVEPSIQDQLQGESSIGVKLQPNLISPKNVKSEEQSDNLTTENKEKHGLLLNVKSIFKSSNKSQPPKGFDSGNKNSKIFNNVEKSLLSLKPSGLEPAASEIETDHEQNVHVSEQNAVEIPTIQSTKSLEDNRKQAKNSRQPAGHKLLGNENSPLVIEKVSQKSYQATIFPNDFMQKHTSDVTEDAGVYRAAKHSEESIKLPTSKEEPKKTSKKNSLLGSISAKSAANSVESVAENANSAVVNDDTMILRKSLKSLFKSPRKSILKNEDDQGPPKSASMNKNDVKNDSVKQEIEKSKSFLNKTQEKQKPNDTNAILIPESNTVTKKTKEKKLLQNSKDVRAKHGMLDNAVENNEEKIDGNIKKFANSLSRIFSSTSKKRTGTSLSMITGNSQMILEDHFEVTKIPLSLSSHSNAEKNDRQIGKSDVADDDKEELVAVKSFDSVPGSEKHNDYKQPSVVKKRSYQILEPQHATEPSYDVIISTEKLGSQFLLAASTEVNRVSSNSKRFEVDDLTKKYSLRDNEEMRKPLEKIHVIKGTIVSYAPMVESAKYISNEHDDTCKEDDNVEERPKRSSGKSFATIRKLLSRASVKSRQDHAEMEDHCVGKIDHEAKRDSLECRKTGAVKYQEGRDSFEALPSDKAKQKSKTSMRKDDKADTNERKSRRQSKKQVSKSEVKSCEPEGVSNPESPVTHSEVLIVNNLATSRSELRCNQETESYECGSNDVLIISDQANITVNNVEIVQDLAEVVISHVRQTDSNNTVETEQQVGQQSSRVKKSSLLSVAKSYIRKRIETGKELESKSSKRRMDEKNQDELRVDSSRLAVDGSKKTSKENGVTKTDSVFSRSVKRLFKKRSSQADSVASNIDAETSVADGRQMTSRKTSLTDVLRNENIEDAGRSVTVKKHDDKSFVIYNGSTDEKNFKNLNPTDELETSKSESAVLLIRNVGKKSIEALPNTRPKSSKHSMKGTKNKDTELPSVVTNSETRFLTSLLDQNTPEAEIQVDALNQYQFKVTPNDLKSIPFATRKSTVVMMATPVPPRKESQVEDSSSSQDAESSSSPTVFYYLLGPTLDEALMDVRIVFQNLIDKITGRGN
ncbi:microtubule-associated protein futsch-like [Neodiprion fabricii]|uniref:microtubule-associated protein futsch-like n=1 Tax=Neodiprion fabricii TaxID=2872261 RepID=UPI001ED8EE50|nr:microtubule-associated protein futsch-like [Neodiprion fabricii]